MTLRLHLLGATGFASCPRLSRPYPPAPLTPAEAAELDAFGALDGSGPTPFRAAQLWEREILWGRVQARPRKFEGLQARVVIDDPRAGEPAGVLPDLTGLPKSAAVIMSRSPTDGAHPPQEARPARRD